MYSIIFILLCTFIGKIHSERCLTPNNETAECISLYSCRILLAALTNQETGSIEFVTSSNCGGSPKNPLVCCGTFSNFTTTTTTDQNKKVDKIKLLPNNKYCGYQHADDYYRTQNDTTIRITEFPWSARIKLKSRAKNVSAFLCAGSLISRRYILTAAQCVRNRDYNVESIQLGEYHIGNTTDCVKEPPFEEECSEPVQEFAIEKILAHPNYDRRRQYNDIALIRLAKQVVFSDYIRPICLPWPERTAAKAGDTLVSTGWGTANFGEEKTVQIKKKIYSTLINHNECTVEYLKLNHNLSDDNLCGIAFRNNTAFECQGDSGGPLMFSHNNQWQQEGIISFGVGCGTTTPDVYTYVKKYLEWILNTIEP